MAKAVPRPVRVPLTAPQAVTETAAALWRPVSPDGGCGVVLAHGAGTDMSNPLLRQLAERLCARGHAVLLFNFAYTAAGRKAPDPMPRLESCYRDVLSVARQRLAGRPLVLGGRSMGGRVASRIVADGEACAGLLFLGYPLHPPRRSGEAVADGRLRTAHWEQLAVPMLFVQGDRDPLADLSLLERERAAKLRRTDARVHVVPGGDHGFAVRKRDGRTTEDVMEEIVDVTHAWLSEMAPSGAAPA